MMAVLASLSLPWQIFPFFSPLALHHVRLNFMDLISWHLSFLILIRSGQRVLLAGEGIQGADRLGYYFHCSLPATRQDIMSYIIP